jgi:hypothetical protein
MLPEERSFKAKLVSGEREPSGERKEAPNGVGKLRRSTAEEEDFWTGLIDLLSGDDISSGAMDFVQSKLFDCCNLTLTHSDDAPSYDAPKVVKSSLFERFNFMILLNLLLAAFIFKSDFIAEP